MHEKRKFPRFPVTIPIICFRYGRRMAMRALNISLSGLKLEANFDLGVGESLDFVILAKNTEIRCTGKILAVEELDHKVHARLRLAPASDSEYRKLSDYLHTLSPKPFQKWVIVGLSILMAYMAYVIIRRYFF
ncbi:MAG: PilZ domain-containing protein [Thermodesulfobacteriota bacterium]